MADLTSHFEIDAVPRTPGGSLVTMCAALGSPVSEQSRVLSERGEDLRAAVYGEGILLPETATRASAWVACLWWRTLWRLGHESASLASEVDAVALLASTLPWVPCDWQADHGRAAVLGEVREEIAWPQRLRGERNGRAKLTQRLVDDMRRRRGQGETLRELSRRFGVSASRVHKITSGDAW